MRALIVRALLTWLMEDLWRDLHDIRQYLRVVSRQPTYSYYRKSLKGIKC